MNRIGRMPIARMVAAAAATVALTVVSACGGSGSSGSGSNTGEYLIGASLALSGPSAVYGSNLGGGMQAYFDYVNKSGGVNGKQIKLSQADGGFDTATTIQSLTKLAQQKPIAIGGLIVSGATAGAVSTIDQLKIPVLIASPVASLNRPPASPYIFGAGGPVISDEAFMLSDFATANLIKGGSPRVLTVNHISTEGESFSENIKKIAADKGWTLVGDESYKVGTLNFDAQAAKIAAAKPDYIFMAPDTSGTTLIKALKAAGVTATILTSQGGPHEDQLADLDYPSIYVGREIRYPSGDAPAVKDYLDRVKASGGSVDPTSHVTQYGYLQAQIITEVLKKCGADCDSAKFLDTIKNIGTIDTQGFTAGPVTYSADTTQGLHTEVVYTWNANQKKVEPTPGTYNYPRRP